MATDECFICRTHRGELAAPPGGPAAEGASLAPTLSRLYPAIRRGTGAERVYLLSTMGRVAHFHAWLVPWPAGSALRGPEYLAAARSCSVADAIAASDRIRAALAAG